jgi:hypothetical protein
LADLDRDLGAVEDNMGFRVDEGKVYDEIRSIKYDIIDIDAKKEGEGSVYVELHKEQERAKAEEGKLQSNITAEETRATAAE